MEDLFFGSLVILVGCICQILYTLATLFLRYQVQVQVPDPFNKMTQIQVILKKSKSDSKSKECGLESGLGLATTQHCAYHSSTFILSLEIYKYETGCRSNE